MQGFAVLRALASSSAVAAWAVVQAHPLIWGGIIAAAQVGDALQNAVPLARQHTAASRLATGLDALFIDVQFEWEAVAAGRLSENEIVTARRRIMKLQHDLETANFPTGLRRRSDLMRAAERDALTYFDNTLSVEPRS